MVLEHKRQATCTYVKRNTEALSYNHCCTGKSVSITYSESVFVALGTQHEMRMCHIINLWPLRLYYIFPHYLINGTIFEKKKKKLLNKKFMVSFSVQLLPETFLILTRTERDIKNVHWSSRKIPIILVKYE